MGVLGSRVVERRGERDLSQGQLATYAEMEQSYLSMIEAGKRTNVGADILERMTLVLETTVEYLIGLTDDPSPIPEVLADVQPDVAWVARQLNQLPAALRDRYVRAINAMLAIAETEE